MIQTEIEVKGLACAMCATHVNDAVRSTFRDITNVKTDLKKGRTTILSEMPIDTNELKRVIAATGYEPAEATSGPYEKKSIFSRIASILK